MNQPRYCVRCGAPIPAGDSFCGKCGQPVAVTPDTPWPSTQPQQPPVAQPASWQPGAAQVPFSAPKPASSRSLRGWQTWLIGAIIIAVVGAVAAVAIPYAIVYWGHSIKTTDSNVSSWPTSNAYPGYPDASEAYCEHLLSKATVLQVVGYEPDKIDFSSNAPYYWGGGCIYENTSNRAIGPILTSFSVQPKDFVSLDTTGQSGVVTLSGIGDKAVEFPDSADPNQIDIDFVKGKYGVVLFVPALITSGTSSSEQIAIAVNLCKAIANNL